MQPLLQFDPATLSIWYSPLLAAEEHSSIDSIMTLGLLGDYATAHDLILASDDPQHHVRGAHMLSAVCHEQRHFVDLLLTNFGQSMTRQFTSLLVNVPAAVQAARVAGRIGLPVTVYAPNNAVKRRIVGVEDNAELAAIAHDAQSRAKLMEQDALEHTVTSGATASSGGRAQLEALGFFTQVTMLQVEFDAEISEAVQRDVPDNTHLLNQYGWAAVLGAVHGYAPSGALPSDAVGVNAAAISALLYGALMVRRWGQPQSGGDSGYAVNRLHALLSYLGGTETLARATSTEEAWQSVDDACAEVFDRSASDELRQDLEHEARFCETVAERDGKDGSPIVKFLDGMHSARVRLAALFSDAPEIFLDPAHFGTVLNAIDPVPIFVSAQGEDDELSAGWTELWMGASQLGDLGEMTWRWAKAPAGAVALSDRIHIVQDVESWKTVVTDMMPMAKLLLRGRRQPSVLGRELDHAELMFNNLDVETRYDPLFATSLADTSTDAFWYWTERPSGKCDACSSVIGQGSGHYVLATTLRRNDRTAAWMVQEYGGGPYGLFRARRDYSDWLLCDACYAEVTQLASEKRGEVRRPA